MRSSRSNAIAFLAGLALAALLAGCPKACPESMLPLEQLVARHNANAEAVPRLWAKVKLIVAAVDGNGAAFTWGSPLLPPNGTLLLAKGPRKLGPHYFLLLGRQSGQEVFRAASSPEEGLYYCQLQVGGGGRIWLGRQEFAGGPGIEDLPVDPNQLLSVLGVFALPEDFTELPTVALEMCKDPCAYVVTYLDRQPVTHRVLFRRQVYFRWSDQDAPRPFRVDLFADDGRRVMTADLSDYQPIQTDAAGRVPEMPMDIRIECFPWPGRKTQVRSIRMILSGATTVAEGHGDPREACRFPEHLSPGTEVIRVDEPRTEGEAK